MGVFRAIVVARWLWVSGFRPCVGQLAGGQVAERVTSATDTSQAYAVYLPPGYTTERRWPALFVLDPRGRAPHALSLFKEGAARLGWVEFAVTLRGHVAGVIAVGGALGFGLGGPETVFAADSGLAFFLAAGTRDFNYEEVLAMGERFRITRVPFRMAVFAGPHRWPSAVICGDALEWLELRAMLGGLRSMDLDWVSRRLARDLSRAADLERAGQLAEALRLNEAISRDYARWPEGSAATARASTLRSRPELIRYEAAGQALAERDRLQAADLQRTLEWARSRRQPPTSEALLQKLRITELQRTANHADSLQAASAQRLLARTFVWLGFYEPRAYIANDAPSRALTMFEVAVRIGPIQGDSCALLHAALRAVTAQPQGRLKGQCPLN